MAELANRVGVSRQTIASVEQGQASTSAGVYLATAHALGLLTWIGAFKMALGGWGQPSGQTD